MDIIKSKKFKAKNCSPFLLRITFTLIFSFVATVIFAQTGTIKGIVVDNQTGESLIGAAVWLEGTTNGAAASLSGNFIIKDVPVGTHTLVTSYLGYLSLKKDGVIVEAGKETEVKLSLSPNEIVLEGVTVTARANRESENALIMDQKQALVATQSVGANELSRKGIGDAQAAVAQVSGVSRQEGVKNVFVRGLGDRYNITLLNGFPIPSEDPEYKNISLDFFTTDIIKNIGVSKVFSAGDYSDVGGAIINISSKELVANHALGIDVSAGVNTAAVGTSNFLRQDGSNYFGFANTKQPKNNQFDFPNSLDPSTVSFPLNHSFGIFGGKSFNLGKNKNPLSFFAVATHQIDYSFTEETIRNSNTAGTVWQDQKGNKYSQNTNQLILTNVKYDINNKHNLQYNFMLVHANHQYVGEYSGYNSERHQDSPEYIGFMRRQQTNDNMLLTNQLLSSWELSKKLKLDVGVSYNLITGLLEPDRRENYFSQQDGDSYVLTGSNRQKRFFSALTEDDINVKAALTYKLNNQSENNLLRIGYVGRFSNTNFEAVEYNFSAVSGFFDIEDVKLDELYNQANLTDGKFRMTTGDANTYDVTKYIHSAYAEASYQFLKKLSGSIGLRMDIVDMNIDYQVQHVAPGTEENDKNYFLPNLNLKYDINDKHSIRLGASKTYTLPQSKEISPYQYVNISFASQGNPNLKPSDNYNLDLKWDYYISPNELLSLTGFYKYIQNPIGRVDEGNSAGLLTYNNISDKATVGGVELEFRKNILNLCNAENEQINRLSVGLSASYIYTNLKLDIRNTEVRNSALEGASPFLVNADISYNFTKKEQNLALSLVFNYFSARIHTIGAGGFNDIIEESVPTLNFVTSYKFNKHFTIKIKASNLLNLPYRLTRESSSGEKITLNEFKKGQNFSLGLSYEF
ncbi:TonB-dependent receptor [Bacteroidales bacterium OttesenSCG-928-C19]|nr:TonB-dependent receptor [Bacteroidales bacterium OttesenSCG-928-C19]